MATYIYYAPLLVEFCYYEIDFKLYFFDNIHTDFIEAFNYISKIFCHLKQGIQDYHMKYVLVPADKKANNIVVVRRLYYVDTLKRELIGTNAYKLQH